MKSNKLIAGEVTTLGVINPLLSVRHNMSSASNAFFH